MLTLPDNHTLSDRYKIISQLGFGGFGITYKAVDLDNGKAVCIKELFILGKCTRNNDLSITSIENEEFSFKKMVRDFVMEGERLSQFSNPNIVSIIDIFYQNNTAYLVLDFVEGLTLKQYIDTKGLMSVDIAFDIMNQILNAVEDIHSKKILHRDIKPENIIITPENKAVLLDFGSAREFADDKTVAQTTMVTPGYAPIEQYNNDARKGQFTDIYALGATLYFLLTGIRPLNATERIYNELKAPHEVNPVISTQVSSAIMLAMQMKPEDRFQNIKDFKQAVQLLTSTGELVTTKEHSQKQEESTVEATSLAEKFSTHKFKIIISFGIFLFFCTCYLIWRNKQWEELRKNKILEIEQNMVSIPSRSFIQGCDERECEKRNKEHQREKGKEGLYVCDDDENPSATVNISSFKISKYEVTQEQWYAIMGNYPSHHSDCDSCPVENITWHDTQAFIAELNRLTDSTYRLPTEAEWEFVSRNAKMPDGKDTEGSYYYKGYSDQFAKDINIVDAAWYIKNSLNKTHPVGEKSPNLLDIYDLVGNVQEWCSDWYEPDYYKTNNPYSEEISDPQGPDTAIYKVARGGAYNLPHTECRIINRSFLSPNEKKENIGFRLARD